MYFTSRDTGCYIDGALGLEHHYSRLADLAEEISESTLAQEMRQALSNEDPDDIANEIADDIIAALQSNTEDGLVWDLNAGDLVLLHEEDAEIHDYPREGF